ncbi:hypothetical protein [Flavobacterium flavigenum]|uniref:hypothetical protein n=1 Tax=Flavobacterium flavigenum TaxID=3003258 RepID=UPI0022AC04B8|nr:hypothetical protein [Flavobacterium flavigenum]
MRKSVLIKSLCVFCVVLFISCSNDDDGKDNTSNEKSVLIKKITETVYYSGESDTSIMDFVYENGVLKSVTTNTRYKTEFVYDGEKISKLNYFRDNVASGSAVFHYNGDFLSYIYSEGNPDEKTEYSYVNGVLATEKIGYIDENKFIIQSELSISYDKTKNITQIINKSSFTGSEIISKENYFYDNKNNPMKFMNKYYRMVFISEGFSGQTTNNLVSRESYYPITNEVPKYYINDIVYNNDNFPIEIKKISKESNNVISKTVIEYQ